MNRSGRQLPRSAPDIHSELLRADERCLHNTVQSELMEHAISEAVAAISALPLDPFDKVMLQLLRGDLRIRVSVPRATRARRENHTHDSVANVSQPALFRHEVRSQTRFVEPILKDSRSNEATIRLHRYADFVSEGVQTRLFDSVSH